VSEERAWLALVTFERKTDETDVLPQWAQGACGWMVALGSDFEIAYQRLVRDLGHCALRILEVADELEVFTPKDVEDTDEYLASNWREIEPGKHTVWGTLHSYKGEGEA